MTKQLIEKNNEVDYSKLRNIIRESRVKTESEILDYLQSIENTSLQERLRFQKITIALIDELRLISKPDLLSLFISEYNLTSEEGLSLMTLVEAFLRVPDNKTRDQLFIDKVAMKSWSKHLGGSKSSMVNLATIALSIADKMIAHGHDAIIKNRIKQALEILSRLTVRFSANNVMKFFAKQFVFAESINAALNSNHSNKNLHSFDMLGEAAWTLEDANKYFLSYRNALIEIGPTYEPSAENGTRAEPPSPASPAKPRRQPSWRLAVWCRWSDHQARAATAARTLVRERARRVARAAGGAAVATAAALPLLLLHRLLALLVADRALVVQRHREDRRDERVGRRLVRRRRRVRDAARPRCRREVKHPLVPRGDDLRRYTTSHDGCDAVKKKI